MLETETKRPPNGRLVVISAPGEAALVLCELDPSTGELVLVDRRQLPGVDVGCGGVPMAASEDGRRIYVAWRGDPYRLFSFAVDGNARRLDCLGQASLPASICYAMVSYCGRRLLTSSYTGSKIAISPIGDDGTAGEPIMTRDAMYAHCLVEAPNGLVYATSLRGDFIQTYRFDADRNDLGPLARLDVPTGSGPRHIVFTADGSRAYLLSEFAGMLTRLDVDPQTGALAIQESVALLPEGEKAWASELRLGPNEDVLYASERQTSQVFAYRLGPSGEMQLTGAEPAPECPRAFSLDASGHHLIVLGEKSGEARTYRIQPDGALDAVSRLHVGTAPSWVLATAL